MCPSLVCLCAVLDCAAEPSGPRESSVSYRARLNSPVLGLLTLRIETRTILVSVRSDRKEVLDIIPYFSWGLFRETADYYYTDDYFDDESRSTTTRRLIADRGDRSTFDPHSRIAYLGRVADLAKRAWTEAERPNPERGVLALADHNDRSIWSKLPSTYSFTRSCSCRR